MKKIVKAVLIVMSCIFAFSASGCGGKAPSQTLNLLSSTTLTEFNMKPDYGKDDYEYYQDLNIIDDKYRNYYEIFVRSFNDSDGDGLGDLNGVTQKLDYLQDLGVTGIWLMPINPSNSYHKYDVNDYYGIDSSYGTMQDFENLLQKAKEKNIRIIMDLVINHSSSTHAWFKAASNAKKQGTQSKYIDYYNWSNSATANYHKLADGIYYEGVFSSNMPDLNLGNQELKAEINSIAKFWLEKGVAGFRLDAAMHLFNNNDDKNIAYWTEFREYCESIYPQAFLVAEVWTNADRIQRYYESGMSSFNYSIGGPNSGTSGKTIRTSLYDINTLDEEMGTRPYFEDDAKTFADRLIDWNQLIKLADPNAIDSMFLTNHDNNRAAGQQWNNIYSIKFAAALYLMAPGNPFIYYGEEIGMLGSGKDENKRAPMNWDEVNLMQPPPAMDTVNQFFPSVAVQLNAKNLIHATYKRALRIRNENPEIARGELSAIELGEGLIGYRSTYNGSSVLIIHNIHTRPNKATLSKDKLGYSTVRGYLNPTGEKPLIKGETITMPAFSTLILK